MTMNHAQCVGQFPAIPIQSFWMNSALSFGQSCRRCVMGDPKYRNDHRGDCTRQGISVNTCKSNMPLFSRPLRHHQTSLLPALPPQQSCRIERAASMKASCTRSIPCTLYASHIPSSSTSFEQARASITWPAAMASLHLLGKFIMLLLLYLLLLCCSSSTERSH